MYVHVHILFLMLIYDRNVQQNQITTKITIIHRIFIFSRDDIK